MRLRRKKALPRLARLLLDTKLSGTMIPVRYFLRETILYRCSRRGIPGPTRDPAPRKLVLPLLDPTGAAGVKVADLWGNHATGAFGALLRLPAGFVAPLHTHTYDIKVVIVSGTYIQAPERKPEFRLGPGSYFLQPGGGYRHVTRCDPASDCVFFVESEGHFDMQAVDAGAPAGK